jgi:PAS domain S-box-containing protein
MAKPDETPDAIDPILRALLDEGLIESPNALYRALVEQVPAVVYIDSDEQESATLYLSPQVEEVFGHPPAAYQAHRPLWWEQTHADDRPTVTERWAQARARNEAFECEYRVRHPDGHMFWVLDRAVPVRGRDCRTRLWQGVVHDITAQKLAAEGLREAESKYRALVENIPAVVYLVAPDDDRRTLYVSPHVEHALGYPRQEWLEQPDIWMELLHPDDREPTLAAHDLANETGEPWSREYRLTAADGRPVWFRDVATLVRDRQGAPLYWQGVQLDITELKEAEGELRQARDDLEFRVLLRTHELQEANELMALEIAERRRVESELREAERKYRMLAEQIPAITYVWEVGQRSDQIVYVSPQVEPVLGYTPSEWGSSTLSWSRVHPDDLDRVRDTARRSETTGEPFSVEARYLAKDGHIVWVLDEAVLLERDEQGRPKTFHGVIIDVSARREAETKAGHAEAMLRTAETKYRTLVEQIPAITFIEDRGGIPEATHFTYLSPQTEAILGFTPQELIEDPYLFRRMMHPVDRERIIAANDRSERTGEPFDEEYRLFARDGRTVWLHSRAELVLDDAGGSGFWHGVALDITAHRAAEAKAAEAEAKAGAAEDRYRTLVEQIPALTYIEMPSPGEPHKTRLIYVSPQHESVLGYSSAELMNPDTFDRILHPDDRERVRESSERAEVTGEPFDEEYRVIAKDGHEVWLHNQALMVKDGNGDPRFWHGVTLDITARKKAEEELRRLEDRYQAVLGQLRSSRER